MINMDKYRDWDILDEMPDGWVEDKTAGSPAPNTVFITDGKSVLHGQKRALLRVKPKQIDASPIAEIKTHFIKQHITEPQSEKIEEAIYPAKTVNDLARLKFKERLLNDIMVDLMICEVEGWDKKEYINELKNLINSIGTANKPTPGTQTKLF